MSVMFAFHPTSVPKGFISHLRKYYRCSDKRWVPACGQKVEWRQKPKPCGEGLSWDRKGIHQMAGSVCTTVHYSLSTCVYVFVQEGCVEKGSDYKRP